jgi:hypothetical protein
VGRPEKQADKNEEGAVKADSDTETDAAATESAVKDRDGDGDGDAGDEVATDGYRPTRQRRGGKARGEEAGGKSGGKATDKAGDKSGDKKGPPPSAYRQFMDEHWDSWLSQVLLIVLLVGGYVGYRFGYLNEGMVGLILVGGLLAGAIYGTAGPAYDLIENPRGRTLFAILALVWAASVGYPALRKAVPRKVLAEAVLTEQNKSIKLPIGENATGPYDVTVSGSLKPEMSGDRKVDYSVVVTGDNNQTSELLGQFEVKVNQMRTRRGSTHWTQQHNQVEHRLPSSIRGRELSFSTESVDEVLENGLHVAVHPQSLNPLWFLITGIFVVLCMIFVESRIGDAKTKPHLIMMSAITLVFSWHFSENANASRLVPPALDALILAVITGGIGGTLVGAVVRRVSGRDKLKPRAGDGDSDGKDKD